jgi:hypothetical protein
VYEPSYVPGKTLLAHPFKLNVLAILCAGSGEVMVFLTLSILVEKPQEEVFLSAIQMLSSSLFSFLLLLKTQISSHASREECGAPGTPTATAPSSVTTTFDSIVDLSKFNEPVTITSPASAIPTDNPLVNFGGQ